MTDLVTQEVEQHPMEMLLALESSGAADEVSLTLTDPDMPYPRWEALGKLLGSVDRRCRWYIGDWLNFGEAVFGETAAQAIDATTSDRYNMAERVTGLDHGTMMNIRSVCGKVPKRNRRPELGFWIHQEVAKLDVDEQPEWLELAVKENLTKSELRESIREAKKPGSGGDGDRAPGTGEGSEVSISERIEEAARLVWGQATSTSDGDFVVPASAMAQLAAALGEE